MANDKLRQIANETLRRAQGGHAGSSAVGGLSNAMMQKQIALTKEQASAMNRLNDELEETGDQAASILNYEKQLLKVRKDSATGIGKYAERMQWLGLQSKAASVEVKKMETGLDHVHKNAKKFQKDFSKYEKQKGGFFGTVFGGMGSGIGSVSRGIIGDYIKASTIYTKNLYQLENVTDIAAKGQKGYSEVLGRTVDKARDYDTVITGLNLTATRFGYTTTEAVDQMEEMDNQLRRGPIAAKKAAEGVLIYSKVLGIGKDAAEDFYTKSINGFGMTEDAARDNLASIRMELDDTNAKYGQGTVFIDDYAKEILNLRDMSASGNVNLRATAHIMAKTGAEAQNLGASYEVAKKTAVSLGELLQKPPPWVQYYAGRKLGSSIIKDLKAAGGDAGKEAEIIEREYGDILEGLSGDQRAAKIKQIARLSKSNSYSDIMTLQEVVGGSKKSMGAVFEQVKKFGTGSEGTQILMDAFGIKDRVQADLIRQLIREGKIDEAIKEVKGVQGAAPLEVSKKLEDNLPAGIQSVGEKIAEGNGITSSIFGFMKENLKSSVLAKLLGRDEQVGSQVGQKLVDMGVGKLPVIGGALASWLGGDKTVGESAVAAAEYPQKKAEAVANVLGHEVMTKGTKDIVDRPDMSTVQQIAQAVGTGLKQNFSSESNMASNAYASVMKTKPMSTAAKMITQGKESLTSQNPEDNPIVKELVDVGSQISTTGGLQEKANKFLKETNKSSGDLLSSFKDLSHDMLVTLAAASPEATKKLEETYGTEFLKTSGQLKKEAMAKEGYGVKFRPNGDMVLTNVKTITNMGANKTEQQG